MFLQISNFYGFYLLSNVLRGVLVFITLWFVVQFQVGAILHLFFLVAASFLPLIIDRHFLPKLFDFLIVITVFTAALATLGDLYDKFFWFDDILHFLAPFVATLVFMYLIKFHLQDKIPDWFLILSSASFGITLETLWEIYEFASSYLFAPSLLRGLEDIVSDLSLAVLGSTISALLVFQYVSSLVSNKVNKENISRSKK